MKKTLISVVLGLVLAAVPMAYYAGCPPTYNGCKLVGATCSGGVCGCAYICGPVTK